MCCIECGDPYVINKHFKLCRRCNNLRLYGNEFGKVYEYIPKPKKLIKTKYTPQKSKGFIQPSKKGSERRDRMIQKDEDLYEKVFNSKPHFCEECGLPLSDQFRDEDGRVIARWQYSHVIPKSIAPQLRHKVENINRLCLKHHEMWENGDKQSMKIYEKNAKNFPSYF